MLEEGTPLYTANFPENKDVVLLDSDEEDYSDNGEKALLITNGIMHLIYRV